MAATNHRSAHRQWTAYDSFFAQPELLIRLGRLTSSSFALLAIVLDPTQPLRNTGESFAMLCIYVFYSLLLTVLPSRASLGAGRHLITHAIDILVLGALSLLTGELASPFLAFASFLLITSAMRWGVKGALFTALLLNLLMTAVGWPYEDPTKSDLNGLIMRSAFSFVAAGMLGYFASYRDRNQRRLTQLAAWPLETEASERLDTGEPWLDGALRHASAVLGGRALLVIWMENEEPRARLGWWDGAHRRFFDISRIECEQALARNPLHASPYYGTLETGIGLSQSVMRKLGLDHIAIAPQRPAFCRAGFETRLYRGCVYVIDPGYSTADLLSLTEIVAERIAFELEQFAMMRDLAITAGWRERSRLARDLHDSVLQDLTAAGLQIRLAARKQPDEVHETLALVGTLLQEQQRRIRSFVEGARPRGPLGQPQSVRARLEALAKSLSRQWPCAIHIDVLPDDFMIPARLAAEIQQMVSEAVANAARHGGAATFHIIVRQADTDLDMRLIDDGKGIDAAAIGETRPESIRARVADLGGQFRLLETNKGLTMQIRLPL